MKSKLFRKRFDIFLIVIFALFLLMRLGLMLTSERSLEGDPASIAVMAMNTFRHGELHYFIYGEPYVGGAALESYLAIIPFSIFGISDFSFKLVSLAVSLALAIVIYLFMKKHFGRKAAYYSLLLSTFTPFVFTRLNVLGMSAYMESLLFFAILTYLFYEISYAKKKQIRNTIFMGVATGIAWWNLEYALVFLIYLLFFWYLMDKRFYSRKLFWVFAISLLLSLSPLIYYNATHDFSNLKHFMAGNFVHKFACDNNLLPREMSYGGRTIDPCKIFSENVNPSFSAKSFLFETLPGVFGGWAYFFIAAILLGFITYSCRKGITASVKAALPFERHNLDIQSHDKALFLVGFFFFWFAIYFVSGRADAKHFLPVFPFVIMLLSIALSRIPNYHIGRLRADISLVLISLIVLSTLPSNVSAMQREDKENISDTISMLNQNSIKYVYTDHPRKWKLLFYSQEQIIASCNICQCVNQYPRIENMMRNTKETAYVFFNGSDISRNLISYLDENGISYMAGTADNNLIIYTLSQAIDPVSVLSPCNWLNEQG